VRTRPFLALGLGLASMSLLAACASASPSPPSTPQGTGAIPDFQAGQTVTVTYCNGEQAKITEPAHLTGHAPAAVYVHGGSWVSGDYDTGGFIINEIGPALAAQGFVVVSVDYRLGADKPWPAQIEDVKCAIRYIRANAGALHVNPNAIGAWGHSAGGHLVSLLGTARLDAGWDVGAYTSQSSRVEAVVDLAGPSDLLTMGDAGESGVVSDSFISLLGNVAPDQLGAELQAASPVTYVAPGDPPFLIFHSDNDPIVAVRQSKDLAWDLGSAGVDVRLVVVHGGGHLFTQTGGAPDPAQITAMVVHFFVQHLLNPPS
jgi:acetyl esterase/lipase